MEELLQKAKQIADDMTRLQKKNTSIRVGLPPMIEALEIPLLALFHKDHPDIRLELHHGNSLSLRKALQDDRIDIAIVSGQDGDQDTMAARAMKRSEIVYCVNQSHPYAREKVLSLPQVAQDDLVEIENSQKFRETILERFHQERCTPRIQWSTTQLYTKIQLIRSGVAGGAFGDETRLAPVQEFPHLCEPDGTVYPHLLADAMTALALTLGMGVDLDKAVGRAEGVRPRRIASRPWRRRRRATAARYASSTIRRRRTPTRRGRR